MPVTSSIFTLLLLAGTSLAKAQFGGFGWEGFGSNRPYSPHPVMPPSTGRRTCTVYPLGNGKDDVPQIAAAFSPSQCGTNGHVVFPQGQTYNIASVLHITLDDVIVDWLGEWVFSTDLDYWRNNSYPIAFQNHHAGFIISGNDIHIDGGGVGGINGNGDVWYTAEAGNTLPGRPMPFVWWNVTDVTCQRFHITDPQLWTINLMNVTNAWFDQMSSNATATQAPFGANWVQNTDGFDTMDAYNIMYTNSVVQTGDDCVAIKPRSYNINVHNLTCHGGNGIAIGSLGQYLEDSSVENVIVDNVTLYRINNDLHNSAYIKTWIGGQTPQTSYESAGLPRGGGWGVVRNLLFSNFIVHGANSGPSITQDNGNNGSFGGTSFMQLSNIAFVNFTGTVNTTGASQPGRIASVSCSKPNPCYNIDFKNVQLDVVGANGTVLAVNETTSCAYVEPGGVHGAIGGVGC